MFMFNLFDTSESTLGEMGESGTSYLVDFTDKVYSLTQKIPFSQYIAS